MMRSFGGNREMGRAVGRAVAAGRNVGGVTRHSTTNNNSSTRPNNISSFKANSSLSSSSSSSSSHLSLANNPWGNAWHSSSSCFPDSDAWEWEHVEEDGDIAGVYDGCVFGDVPSRDEVDGALTSLQLFLGPTSNLHLIEDCVSSSSDNDIISQKSSPSCLLHRVASAGSDMDWIEPSMQCYNGRVYDAFHLLQTEPSVQRAIISLSTDKAVWDAVMNNDVVRELRDNYAAESDSNSTGSPVAAKSVLSWILDTSKAKFMELMDKVTKLLSEVFIPSHGGKDEAATDKVFEEIVKPSVLISVLVLLIVIVTRAHKF